MNGTAKSIAREVWGALEIKKNLGCAKNKEGLFGAVSIDYRTVTGQLKNSMKQLGTVGTVWSSGAVFAIILRNLGQYTSYSYK